MSVSGVYDTELPNDQGTLYDVIQSYTAELSKLQQNVDQALAEIQANPSDPGALSRFQAAQADFTTFKQFLSTLIKNYQDMNSGIIRNIG